MNFFSKAVTLTPYDPNAYSLRALSILALQQKGSAALLDLESALELDASDATAARIISAIRELLTGSGAVPRSGCSGTVVTRPSGRRHYELAWRYKLPSAPDR